MLSEKLYQCRIHKKMSLDTLADKLGVSRQAVQKWESGVTKPTIENLLALSEIFNVSLDYLCGNYRLMHEEGFRMGYEITPSFEKQPTWECYSKELEVEYRQSVEEGKDIEAFKELFSEVSSLPDGKYKDKIADVLFEIVTQAPQRADYKYTEPSDLGRIRQFTKPYDLPMPLPDDDILLDKILGGWLGRVCGCFLGKPVEGIMEPELRKILKRTGNYPMHRYIDKEECTEEVMDGLNWNIAACAYPRDYGKMPCDDDTNYTIMGYKIIERYGKDFTAENVASMWLATQVKNAYCTAERVAYRNFVNGYLPPESAEYKNPYREWIGAQIRGDFFGYFNPCNPRMAAEMAHRDASISHIKNGIYGEMFVSAMIAAAFSTKNPEEVIRCGMAEIPSTSRLYEAIEKVLEGYEKPGTYTVKLTAVDSEGEKVELSREVAVSVGKASTQTIICSVTAPTGGGSKNIGVICDGVVPNASSANDSMQYDTFIYTEENYRRSVYIGYVYKQEKQISTVSFTEGNHFGNGGWFADGTLSVEVLKDGVWQKAEATVSPAYPNGNALSSFGKGYETYVLTLKTPGSFSGVRLIGIAGGGVRGGFISCSELAVS